MSTTLEPILSFSRRAYISKVKGDIYANYAISSQCETLGFPTNFVDSLRSFYQIRQNYIDLIRPYCCSRHYFSSYLNSDLYYKIHSLDQYPIIENSSDIQGTEIADIKQFAIQSGYFDPNFYRLTNPDLYHCSNAELVNHFFDNSVNEPNRDPSQYFSVSQYYNLHPDVKDAQLNALRHYLMYGNIDERQHAPSNKILDSLVTLRDHIDILDHSGKCKTSIFQECQVAIYLHIYYPESLHEFLEYLTVLPSQIRLVITTTTSEKKELIIEILERALLINRLDLCHVYHENKGRDIGAFINIYDELIKYDVVCKLHAKKSPHLGEFGKSWFRYLIRSTIGNQSAIENIVNILYHSKDIGILAPTSFQGTNNHDWASNFDISQSISDHIFNSELDINKEKLRYPSATVFWFKPEALNQQQFRSIQPDFFPEEPIPIDGTTAHSLERLIPYISILNGLKTLYYFDPSLYLKSIKEWNVLESIKACDDRNTFIIVGHDASNSGAPRTALALQRSLINDLNLNCIVILLNDGPLLQAYKDNGPTFVFKNNLVHSYLNAVFKYSDRLLNVVTNTVITAVVGQLAQAYGHTHVALVHENADTGYWPSEMFGHALNGDLCVFPGEGVAQAAYTICNIDAPKNVAIRPQGIYRHNFPDLLIDECYESVRTELGIPKDSKIILGCGTIEPRKGVDIFIETADFFLNNSSENIFFLWIGDLPASKCDDRNWAEQLLDKLKDLPNSNCLILGGCTKADRYFQACDVFYLTSRKDPFPGVVLEAMACKKPIIAFEDATDVGNAFNDGTGGFLLSQFDVTLAAEKIYLYIKNPQLAYDAGIHNENVIQRDYIFSKYANFLIERSNLLRSAKLQSDSVISFIVPIFKTPLLYLQQLLSSVQSQSYPNWELCLGGGDLDQDVLSYLNYKMLSDHRIKYIEVNSSEQGISVNSNAAISICTGKYIALLDHDDLLSANCALEIISIHEENDCDFVYTAEDKVDGTGLNFYGPVYKNVYSEEKLLKNNYITHLSSFSRELIKEIGGFRPEYDGAQDYDLILRASSHAKKIFYLPRVLYHWRVFEDSTSGGSPESKPYAIEAGRKAVETFLIEKGKVRFTVQNSKIPFSYDIIYD
ncbi:rhamnan synthesis F family protein [Synechococcus sp. BL107]|uniref:rhamnan synthesis F family protein n=1 Tax=Synechococcus sp. BL107 TaxID=313625 RepID=UPI0002E185B0|nr:rhamnan synthesis F family protein [Synechococcus sp. BL107]